MDIQAFVQHQERDRKPFLANEPEIDGLVRIIVAVAQNMLNDERPRWRLRSTGRPQDLNSYIQTNYAQGYRKRGPQCLKV